MILPKVHALLKQYLLTIQISAIALMNIIPHNLDANLVWNIAQHVQIPFPALKQNLIETFLMVKYIFLTMIAANNAYSLIILMLIEGSCDPGYFDDEKSCIAGSFAIPYRTNTVQYMDSSNTAVILNKTSLLWDSTYSSFFMSFSVNWLNWVVKDG